MANHEQKAAAPTPSPTLSPFCQSLRSQLVGRLSCCGAAWSAVTVGAVKDRVRHAVVPAPVARLCALHACQPRNKFSSVTSSSLTSQPTPDNSLPVRQSSFGSSIERMACSISAADGVSSSGKSLSRWPTRGATSRCVTSAVEQVSGAQ